MNIRCAIGIHKWIPRVRRLARPLRHPGIPIFSWGWDMRIIGFWPPHDVYFRKVGEQCTRCRARRIA